MGRNTNEKLCDFAERVAAKHFGCSKVKASGQGFAKSDFYETETRGGKVFTKSGGWRGEVKSSQREKFVVQANWFGKISREAKDVDQLPCLFFLTHEQTGFALKPCDCPEDDICTVIGSTKGFTGEELSEVSIMQIDTMYFEKYGCGVDYCFNFWQVEKVF